MEISVVFYLHLPLPCPQAGRTDSLQLGLHGWGTVISINILQCSKKRGNPGWAS